MPLDISLDSSFRVEFLFGSQAVRSGLRESATQDLDFQIRQDTNFRLPVLAGTVEVSPLTFISGRLAGATSILEQEGEFQRFAILSAESVFKAKPGFSGWEAAGLCHLWNGDGYRFSVTAGYRQEFLSLAGEGVTGNSGVNRSSRDDFSSYGPFMGLQTAVFFPWWKARCELLGSPWMWKQVSGSVIRTDSALTYFGRNQGWLLEVQLEGTMYLTRGFFVGIHGRYTSQESNGDLTRTDNGSVTRQFKIYTDDSFAMVGLDLTLVF